MKVGPSESLCGERPQTTSCCAGRETGVVSDEEKAPERCQVGTGKANVSESLTTCRDDYPRDIETGVSGLCVLEVGLSVTRRACGCGAWGVEVLRIRSDQAACSARTSTMPDPTVCCARSSAGGYCVNCDLLVGLTGVRVVAVAAGRRLLTVTVESPPGPMGCPACGVVAVSHGRRTHVVIDTPCFGRPVRLRWRKRTWSCPEPACDVGTFTERADDVAAPRALLSTRARWWAVRQLRREHASVAGLARLSTTAES